MNDCKLEISDYYVLLNLHKALLEAKFHINPDNELVCISPIIADISNQLVEILNELDGRKDKNTSGRWEEWRKIENQHFYRERAKGNANLNGKWIGLSIDEKRKVSKNLLSPFKATLEEIDEFIKEVDEAVQNNR